MKTLLSKFVLAPVVMAAAALAPNAAVAAPIVKVPFNFSVGNKICPAGTYSVKRDLSGDFVTLQNSESSQSYRFVLGPGATDNASAPVVLQFDAIGDTNALRTVQYGAKITGQLDKKTRVNEHIPARAVSGQ